MDNDEIKPCYDEAGVSSGAGFSGELRGAGFSRERTQEERLEDIGKAAYESIAEMVAALNCDYDRLEELKEGRESLENEYGFPDPAALTAWNEANREELAELTEQAGECAGRDDALERVLEDPLSLEVRSNWHTPGDEGGAKPGEFCLLLAMGGPAVRIIGGLDEHCEPYRARLEVQDWFTPWAEYYQADSDVLLAYARCFYYGEG